ncbi:MAG: peroxiredoxin family protein [Verrucomicrobiales bacterium]
MFPHERSLVEKMKDRPFALVGVNSDPKEKLQQGMKRQEINWRSWWDGGNTRGPIATRWGITGWPTLYVVDHKGIIRVAETYSYQPVQDAIATILAEIDADA